MGWADSYIKKLQNGETVKFRPRGNSMRGKIESGQLVTVVPVYGDGPSVRIGDVVLCKVKGSQYLHLVTAWKGRMPDIEVQISNMKGHVNGWTPFKNIYGKVIKIEP